MSTGSQDPSQEEDGRGRRGEKNSSNSSVKESRYHTIILHGPYPRYYYTCNSFCEMNRSLDKELNSSMSRYRCSVTVEGRTGTSPLPRRLLMPLYEMT